MTAVDEFVLFLALMFFAPLAFVFANILYIKVMPLIVGGVNASKATQSKPKHVQTIVPSTERLSYQQNS